ncbi:hypothetical protein AX14_005385 [Amanita brunnescens Koide BX004]|nr:hypothetical protein AX14_005385 [Amanita brunnescens Koide BX004]
MGRWTQYDEDEYNLPEGMKRIGYDDDTQCYYYKDKEGSIWRGVPGARYSEMTRVSSTDSARPSERDIEEAGMRTGASRRDGYQLLSPDGPAMAHKSDINAGAYRTLFPFFLLISAVLLLVWRLVLSPTLSTAPVKLCPKAQTIPHLVQPGDTCWEIAKAQGCSLEELKELNAKAHCDKLMPGEVVCVPGEKTKVNPAMLKRSARN